MYKFTFAILFWFLSVAAGQAQTYQCQYRIIADSGFIKPASQQGIFQEQVIQSSILKHFFDGMLINITTNNKEAVSEFIPLFLQKNKVKPGAVIPRKVIVGQHETAFEDQNGVSENVHISIAPSAFDNQQFYDKTKMISYYIQPHPQLKVTCQPFVYKYSFKKTRKKKRIGRWLCQKWLPEDKAIKEQVAVWVCDSLPKEICPPDLCNHCFNGGVVRVVFKRGFHFDLMSYSQLSNPGFRFPKVTSCDSTIQKADNFIDNELYNPIGLDFKYNMDGK